MAIMMSSQSASFAHGSFGYKMGVPGSKGVVEQGFRLMNTYSLQSEIA